jgi:hypothetical protein
MWIGEFSASDVVDFKFTTRGTTGTPTTLGGTPALSVYKANGTVESTTGITLTADFDARTGLNHVRITTASDGTFYADGNDFQVVITTGTVGGTSVVGEVVAHFTLRNRAGLKPTTAGRTLDVAATGEAGLDFNNINDAAGAHTLTNIRIPLVTLTDTVTTLTGNTPQTGDNFARLGAPAGASVSADIAAAKADTGTLTTRIPGTVQPQTGDAFARLGAPIGASISADIQTRSTYAGGAVASVTAPVTVGSLGAGSISTATFAAGATIPAVAQVNGPNITLSGTVSDSAPLPSSFKVAGLPNVPGVTYPGMTLVFTSGNLQGVHRSIATDLGGAAPRTLTFTTAYPVSPANGDAFIILA